MVQYNSTGTVGYPVKVHHPVKHAILLSDNFCQFLFSEMEEALGISAIEENIHVKHLCECGYYTADKSNYNKHKKRCKLQAKTWQSDAGLSLSTGATSKSRESGERQKYMCDFCGKTFLSKYGMKLHVKTQHEKNFKHTCSVCNKTFNQTIQFRYHYSKHLQVPIEKCELCKRAFTSHGSLNRHLKICKSNPASYEKFRCNVCDMSFSDRHRLHEHQRGKHLPPRYTCNICNKTFSWRSSLKVHKKTCG